ncbi:hypothetical protein [Shinella sp. M27]|uniref:hypothetical protein n=1 Tax=Shinella sp. M27 TaxID=3368614 RepID=UPI003B9EB456
MALRLFSADRRGMYHEGPLTLMKEPPRIEYGFLNANDGTSTSDDLRVHCLELFPEGLSIHGWQFLTSRNWVQGQNEPFLTHNEGIELVFEFVRLAHFPDRPSRMQSYFAFDSIEQVKSFSDAPVYEMMPAASFMADMNWLKVGGQFAYASYNAHQYWRGAATPDPRWEYLLVPPVVIQIVPIANG